MGRIYSDITQCIGNTPLVWLKRLCEQETPGAQIFAKLEYMNPAGSIKDRAAYYMIRDAQEKGLLSEDSVIVEPTSGNTGIGLAQVGAAFGYRVVLTMPDTMSEERRRLLSAYGAELVLTDGALGMSGAIAKARELAEKIPGSYIPGQFSNPANALAHERTTGPEIWEDAGEKIDILVAGVGTGGTLTGTGRYLRTKNPELEIVAVEPEDSAVLSGKPAGSHKLQGIGAGFVPELMDTRLCSEILPVSFEEAARALRALVQLQGILAGISSGAALAAALRVAKRPQNAGKRIVVIFPDSGERYLSTGAF